MSTAAVPATGALVLLVVAAAYGMWLSGDPYEHLKPENVDPKYNPFHPDNGIIPPRNPAPNADPTPESKPGQRLNTIGGNGGSDELVGGSVNDSYTNPSFTDPFNEGEDTQDRKDPLILDLNGDGIVSTTTVTNGAYFDMDCSGFAEQTAWANAGDGLLARDVDKDGWITDGKELFGDQTLLASGNKAANGFEALADLDSNGDNKIDVNDEAFVELGVIKNGEFFYLDELGITEISLNTTDVNEEQNGNTLVKTADFIKNGETFQAGEFNLQSNTFYTIPIEYDESVDMSTVEHLPEAIGYGNVHNLNYAMAADETGELKALVEDFIYMGPDTEKVLTPSERYALAA